MTSLKLSDGWDLSLDANGNLATVQGDDAAVQDASSAVRLFRGELWYDTLQGLNWKRILGKLPTLNVVKALIAQQAMNAVGVKRAKVFISSFSNRQITGQLQIAPDTSNAVIPTNFTVP